MINLDTSIKRKKERDESGKIVSSQSHSFRRDSSSFNLSTKVTIMLGLVGWRSRRRRGKRGIGRSAYLAGAHEQYGLNSGHHCFLCSMRSVSMLCFCNAIVLVPLASEKSLCSPSNHDQPIIVEILSAGRFGGGQ